MCVTGTGASVKRRNERRSGGPVVHRRQVLGAGLAASVAALVPAIPAAARQIPARQVLDLTHTFAVDVPTYRPEKPHRETMAEFPMPPEGEFGFYNQRWIFTEHVGTHMDAPGHVIGGARLSPEIAPVELMAPAAVVDIRHKVSGNPNAMVEVADIVAFERGHGRIPEHAAVLMNSGWADRWDDGDLAYRGTSSPDEFPFNFPGWSPEAVEFLIQQRDIRGVGVDTLSTDPGNSTTFPAHEVLGRADRWGLENLSGLEGIPPAGATIFVGLVPWEEGSGGPARVLAVV